KIYNSAGEVKAMLVKGGAKADDIHGVDALSGATLTSNGVTRTLQFWFGEEGYATFIAKYRAGGVN
ncbi:MAG: FMN-binding protein, partial [Litorilituus sp.]|nr:FMN-binding protein [Litorilituus sp.]